MWTGIESDTPTEGYMISLRPEGYMKRLTFYSKGTILRYRQGNAFSLTIMVYLLEASLLTTSLLAALHRGSPPNQLISAGNFEMLIDHSHSVSQVCFIT